MKSFTVPAKLLKAASIFQSDGDLRYYLQGIYLDKDNKRVVGTNGHFMFIGQDDSFGDIPKSGIIRINGTIPASADKADIIVVSKSAGFMSFRKFDGSPSESKGYPVRLAFHVIDGKFPDVDKALPSSETKEIDSIGVNSEYFGRISKACRALGSNHGVVKQVFRGECNAIELRLVEHKNVTIVLMPCRV